MSYEEGKKPTEVVIKPTLTVRSLVIGVVLTLLVIFVLPYLQFLLDFPGDVAFPTGFMMGSTGGCIFWPAERYRIYINLFLALVPILITMAMPKKYRLNPTEIAFICAMVFTAPHIVVHDYAIISAPTIPLYAMASSALVPYIQNNMSPLLSPKNLAILSPMISGGAAVPWGDWAIPMLYWIVHIGALYIFMIFWAAILKKIWYDVESLNFPVARIITSTIQTTEPNYPKPKAKLLWIGAIVGFLIMIIPNLNDFGLVGAQLGLGYDYTGLAIANLGIALCLRPMELGFALNLPNDVLFTTLVSFVVLFWILPQFWIQLGWATTLPPGNHIWYWFNGINAGALWKPTSPLGQSGYSMFGFGLMAAFVFLPLIIHRGAVIEQLKGFVRGKTAEDTDNRINWLGFIVCAIVYIATLMAVNLPIQHAILGWLLLTFIYTGYTRVYVETGGYQGNIGRFGFGGIYSLNWIFGVFGIGAGVQNDPNVAMAWVYPLSFEGQEVWLNAGMQSYPTAWFMDSYAIGTLTGANNRHIIISSMIGIILAVAIGFPYVMWCRYTEGTVNNPVVGGASIIGWARTYVTTQKNPVFPEAPIGVWISFIIGLVLAGVLYLARARYGGLMNLITPVGILNAMLWGAIAWLSFLVAFIIKMIVLRIGGAGLYEEKVRPFGIGMMVGYALLWPVLLVANIYIHFLGIPPG